MIQNFILMNGFGLFVWSSFAITLLACISLYYRTLKTLRKNEKDFAQEIQELSKEKKQIVLKKSKIASQVFASYNKII